MNASRLRRLRLRLTLLFTASYAIGLVVLSVYVVSSDGRITKNRVDADLRNKADVGERSVSFAPNGSLDVSEISGDPNLAEGYPQLYVVESSRPVLDAGGDPVVGTDGRAKLHHDPKVAFSPSQPYFPKVDVMPAAKRAATRKGEVIAGTSTQGQPLRMLAVPVADGSTVRGAVVAVISLKPFASDHRRLTLIVWIGSAALVLTSGLAGFLLAGRSTRPAAEALAQQERFLADAAHELRTPVAAMRAASESALAGDESPLTALERTERLAVATSALLDDLLVLARMDAHQQPLHSEPVRLDLLVEEVLASRDDDPPVTLVAEEVVVDADASLVRRAIANLVDNAARHGRDADASGDITITVTPNRVVVADRGPGIEPSLMPHLFERFRSGRRSGGSGLGLAIVDWVAQAHGGSAEAANRDGGGAVFSLVLPE